MNETLTAFFSCVFFVFAPYTTAHPLAVTSEILKCVPDNFFVVSASSFVEGVLSKVETGGVTETFGLWQHELMGATLQWWPTSLVLQGSRLCTAWFARLLEGGGENESDLIN